jgi:hypothetical protein
MGDDIAFHGDVMPLDATSPRGLGPYVLRHLVRTNGLIGGAGKLMQMVAQRDHFRGGVLAVCEVPERLADRFGTEIPPTGKPVSFRFAMAVERRPGAEVASAVDIYFDQLDFLGQLGLIPAPAAA